jgi:hypothetical protein
MGGRPVIAGDGDDGFYAPTCNLLVRRSAYQRLGGLREELRLGEDVDLCWRLRKRGLVLVYAPEGIVRHRHPERLPAMLRRRADYGSSEAHLYKLHPDRRGRLRLPPPAAATVALVSAGLVLRRPWVLAAALAPPALDAALRARRLWRAGAEVPAAQVLSATLRGHLSALYFAYFRLVRYHLGELTAAAALLPGARLLAAAAIFYAAGVDYATRRPRLTFPEYLFLYVAEHAAYQTGVHAGRVASWRRLPVHCDDERKATWPCDTGSFSTVTSASTATRRSSMERRTPSSSTPRSFSATLTRWPLRSSACG